MTARPLKDAAPKEWQAIDCNECGQLLARRWVGGRVEPVVPGPAIEADGRIMLVCPRCERRVRVRPKAA